jgi:hypothetical protein
MFSLIVKQPSKQAVDSTYFKIAAFSPLLLKPGPSPNMPPAVSLSFLPDTAFGTPKNPLAPPAPQSVRQKQKQKPIGWNFKDGWGEGALLPI